MRKYQMLVNKKQEKQEEGHTLHYKLEGKIDRKDLEEMEIKLDGMKAKLKNDRSQRWRNWVEHSWGHKKKDIYKCIRGKKGNGSLIVSNGGTAQMKDRLKLAEETWGGLRAVDAEELPKFSKQKMALITECEVRRVVNNLADGKAKGVDGW
eukprot:784773-Heterocapsa_arctica.AAC.1